MKYICLVFIFISVLGLSACGKMSEPSPLEGSGYPHSYPRY